MTVEDILGEIAADKRSGATELAARGLDAFEELLLCESGHKEIRCACEDLARRLNGVRSSMGAIGAQALLVLARARGLVTRGVDWLEAMRQAVLKEREALASAPGKIASVVLEQVGNGRAIATCSWSATVVKTLESLAPSRVVVSDGGGLGDGLRAARWLAARAVNAEVTPDCGICGVIGECDAVLIGADQILMDGAVVNRTGSFAMALAAAYMGKPFYVVCHRTKFSGRHSFDPERYDPGYETPLSGPVLRAPLFEAVPAGLVTSVLTENGALSTEDVRRANAAMARLREEILNKKP